MYNMFNIIMTRIRRIIVRFITEPRMQDSIKVGTIKLTSNYVELHGNI